MIGLVLAKKSQKGWGGAEIVVTLQRERRENDTIETDEDAGGGCPGGGTAERGAAAGRADGELSGAVRLGGQDGDARDLSCDRGL